VNTFRGIWPYYRILNIGIGGIWPYYRILNIGIGGIWPGSSDDTTIWPQQMIFDWVRVYQQKKSYHQQINSNKTRFSFYLVVNKQNKCI
jgi:hypothetical protein